MYSLRSLHNSLKRNADASRAADQAAYLKNQFPFFGIQKPALAHIVEEWLEHHPITDEQLLIRLVENLWERPQREYAYIALLLIQHNLDLLTPRFFDTVEMMIRTNSWWDTVDSIASTILGPLTKKFEPLSLIMDIWIKDENMWIRRAALLHQLKFKKHTNEQRLFGACKALLREQDFFIRKAIGWALREYSKTAPRAVATFITKHKHILSPLSVREGSKYLQQR